MSNVPASDARSRCCISSCSAQCCSRWITSSQAAPTIPMLITVDASVGSARTRSFQAATRARSQCPRAASRSVARGWTTKCSIAKASPCSSTKGDPAIRDRVIFKMLGLIEAGARGRRRLRREDPAVTGFEKNRARNTDQPAAPADFRRKSGRVVLQDWIDARRWRSSARLPFCDGRNRYTVKVTRRRSRRRPRGAGARASE